MAENSSSPSETSRRSSQSTAPIVASPPSTPTKSRTVLTTSPSSSSSSKQVSRFFTGTGSSPSSPTDARITAMSNPMSSPYSANWSRTDILAFENAIAKYDEDTPDRWSKVAACVPGLTAEDAAIKYDQLMAMISTFLSSLVLPRNNRPSLPLPISECSTQSAKKKTRITKTNKPSIVKVDQGKLFLSGVGAEALMNKLHDRIRMRYKTRDEAGRRSTVEISPATKAQAGTLDSVCWAAYSSPQPNAESTPQDISSLQLPIPDLPECSRQPAMKKTKKNKPATVKRNQNALIKLETDVERVIKAQDYLELFLESTENRQKEVDEAYRSIEEQTESLYKDMFGIAGDHLEAASSGDAPIPGGEAGVHRGLKLTQERIRAMIQHATGKRDGEINEDRRSQLDATVNMLNERLFPLRSIDEKAERLTLHLKSLINRGDQSSASRKPTGTSRGSCYLKNINP